MSLLYLWRWRRRIACHGTVWCCQHQDKPMCNSWRDPHLLARLRYRRRTREEHE